MKVAVAGGTGVVGHLVVEALRGNGHEAVALARSTGVELVSGKGLAGALAGTDAVIDVSNIATTRGPVAAEFFEATARNLTRAGAEAGVRHVVALSIIGVDRVPFGYYRGKLRQEEVLAGSPVPVTILRAAQFHEFPVQYLARSSRGLVVVPKWRAQPVAAREVAAELAALATGTPAPMSELAGPREENMADLLRRVLAARGERRRVIELRIPGSGGKAMAAGGGLPGPGARLGTQTFAGWLSLAGWHPRRSWRCAVSESADRLAGAFSQARPRLVRVAYAILGSHAEAEDVVADCWPRLVAAHDQAPVRDVESWAVVAVSRMALDVLRSARVRREQYVGPWLPEPVVGSAVAPAGGTGVAGPPGAAGFGADPAEKVTLDDEVSYALLVVLETLSPAERTAFVLHDLFGMPFGEVATVVGRSADAVRQLASRARRHVRSGNAWSPVNATEHRRVVSAFSCAVTTGDLSALIAVLDPDVVLVSDGGGVVSAARRPVRGADRVARFLLGVMAKVGADARTARVTVNGALGFALYEGGDLVTVASVTVARDRVTRLDLVRAPAKLPRPAP